MGPESGGVVQLQSVAQLVDHDIVDDMRRGEHQQAIEIEVSLAGAAAPAAALIADGDVSVAHAYDGGVMPHALRYNGQGLPGQLLNLGSCKLRLGFRELCQMALDPAPFALDIMLDLGVGCGPGGANHDALRGDLDGDAFPVAADEGVGDRVHGDLLC